MHYLTIVFIVWAVRGYRLACAACVSLHSDSLRRGLPLSGDCNEHQHKEQESILARVRKVQPAVRVHDRRHLPNVRSVGGHFYLSTGPAVEDACLSAAV